MRKRLLFILVCACFVAAYFGAVAGAATYDPGNGILSWFDGR